MTAWDRTHGKVRGAYLKAGTSRLYVRETGDRSGWLLYVDGQLEGRADGEEVARAAAELAVRCVMDAQVAGEATAA
jgi:hypothetical protein